MSFGNRSNYCSLKEAFNTPTFDFTENEDDKSYEIKESFTPESEASEETPVVRCNNVVSHANTCSSCYKSITKKQMLRNAFNEILNMIMIVIMIWIIIYKPKY